MNGHDDLFLRGTKERGGGVSDLLMDVESDVDRFDVGFGGEGGFCVKVTKGWSFFVFLLWGDDENVWHLYRAEGGGWDRESV